MYKLLHYLSGKTTMFMYRLKQPKEILYIALYAKVKSLIIKSIFWQINYADSRSNES